MATKYQTVTSTSHRKFHHKPCQLAGVENAYCTPSPKYSTVKLLSFHRWCPHGRLEIPPMQSHHPGRGARQDLRIFWEQKFICMNCIAQIISIFADMDALLLVPQPTHPFKLLLGVGCFFVLRSRHSYQSEVGRLVVIVCPCRSI